MKAIKKLFDTKTKLIVALVVLAILLVWIILFFVARDTAIALVKPLLWTFLLVTAAWVGIHFGVKAWRKRKRSEFDERIAAKEGIEDRRREWATWTEELEKQGIDRYELPFYLLVGEPQSGKSVLLHNSDLHFPFGQNRLSGVGGTRGCDWWFTEEAVILDLAGRLFTHEGGAADRLEFEAFLSLLYEFRPLCPANGVILVIPCNSLLEDTPEQCGAKATKIQNALLSLTTQLQAQLPVYLVLTKGDQVFGFAECVHRLDVERRHQMFGWSRPAEKLDSPFDLKEVLDGYEGIVQRARFLRAHMVAGARLPEALPEIDRMYAFPHELAGMQANLETYLKRIFTASNVTDRVFFRGVYLTSGLQSGVPIAKVCTELFGQAGEADRRNLEALFSKQRAYFIKDLIRTRVFGERGLVRPTQGRVQQARRTSVIGYGLSAAIVLASVVFAGVYLLKGTRDEELRVYETAIEEGRRTLKEAAPAIPDLLYRLQLASDAAEHERDTYEEAFTDTRGEFRSLYRAIFDTKLVPALKRASIEELEARLGRGCKDHAELRAVCDAMMALIEDLDLSDRDSRDALLAVVPPLTSTRKTVVGGDPLGLARAFQLRMDYGSADGLLSPLLLAERERLVPLARKAVQEIEQCLVPGVPTQPQNELGYMLAWFGAEQAREELGDAAKRLTGSTIGRCRTFARSMHRLEEIEKNLESDTSGRSLRISQVLIQSLPLGNYRNQLRSFLEESRSGDSIAAKWSRMDDLMAFAGAKFEGHESGLKVSDTGLHYGSEDFGQTLFQMQESLLGTLSGKIVVPSDYDPIDELSNPPGLLALCEQDLPLDLRKSGLLGLSKRIRDIDENILVTAAGQEPVEVFKAECAELANRFPKELPSIAEARGSAGVGAGEALPYSLLRELVDLHVAIGGIVSKRELVRDERERMRGWQGHIEKLLDELLRQRGAAGAWLPPLPVDGTFAPEAWDVLSALSDAARIEPVLPQRHPVAAVAGEAQRAAFAELANQLADRWSARPPEQLEQTLRTVQELGQLALEVSKRPGFKEALSGVELDAWSGRVDGLLQVRLGGLVANIERIWRAELQPDRPLPSVVSRARSELASVAEKIRESDGLGMAGIAPILAELKEGGSITGWLPLTRTNPVLVELRQWKIPARATEVQDDPEYQDLMRSLERLGDVGSGDGAFVAREYADRFARPAPPTPAANAGIRLVRGVASDFAARLRNEVRAAYLQELQDMLESNKNRDFLDVLFWEPGMDVSRYRDGDVQEALERLFKKKGELEKLAEKYVLAGSGSVADKVFPSQPLTDEDDWARVHRFLSELGAFLLAGDEAGRSVRAAKFGFWLIPETGAAESVWALGSMPPEERKDFFYYPGNDSSENLQKEPMGPNMQRLRVSGWGFEVNRPDRTLWLLWSKKPTQSEARADPLAYRASFPGCLAPLFLAWSGRPLDDETREEFLVSLELENAKRRAPLRIQFERPVPARPARP